MQWAFSMFILALNVDQQRCCSLLKARDANECVENKDVSQESDLQNRLHIVNLGLVGVQLVCWGGVR